MMTKHTLNLGLFVALPLFALAAPRDVLTEKEAQTRAAQVTDVQYGLQLEFDATSPTYDGYAEIRFKTLSTETDVRVDFISKKVDSVELNGEALSVQSSVESLFTLPAKRLAPENVLKVKYTSDFSNSGDGLHKFVDPEDQRVYLHTDFEPFRAHTVFPCFDQPDLRASFKVVVTAPSDWKVVSNNSIEKTTDGPKPSTKVHSFKQTPPISTYLLAVIAGPYMEWKDKSGKIPLGIYTRQSVKKHVDAGEIFTITKQGLKFFQDYFKTPYPFEKYDQIFLPEYNHGAMENAGAVTLNERRYIFRRTPTELDRQKRGSVILHEMAHMWFGDLVTMKWWNDLWLNESFATFMGNMTLATATRFRGGWDHFYSGTKTWAYWQDELSTTHPIVATIADTDETFTNFDGITYGKGASALKQLHFLLGQEGFRKGMETYFKINSWKNTTLKDFLGALETATGRDLTAWSKEWLETEGVTSVEAKWACQDKKISEFNLLQGPANQSNQRRTHKTRVAIYRLKGEILSPETVDAEYSGESTSIPALIGKPCPEYVFPNFDDLDYAKVYLDSTSLETFKKSTHGLRSATDRLLAWGALWTMVRDQKMSAKNYLELALRHLQNESSMDVVSMLLDHIKSIHDYYLDTRANPALSLRIESTFKSLVLNSRRKKLSDLQLMYFDALVHHARSTDMLATLASLLGSRPQEDFRGFAIDQERRWKVLVRLASQNYLTLDQLVAQEKKRDPSDFGNRKLVEIDAARPDAEAKEKYWNIFTRNQEKLSLEVLRAGMEGFNQPTQQDLLGHYSENYFKIIESIFKEKDLTYASRFIEGLFPGYDCSEPNHLRASKFASRTDLPQTLRKMVLEETDELGRCVKIRRAL